MPTPNGDDEFSIRDAERILKSIFPQVGEDPLGKILAEVIQVQEDQLAFEQGYDQDQKQLGEKLDEISSRTFGILFLQIIKTIKLLMGLLPAGKFILLAIAGTGLVISYLQGEPVGTKQVVEAFERSGLGAFMRRQLRAITEIANAQAERIETVIDLGSDVVRASATHAENILTDLTFQLEHLNDPTVEIDHKVETIRAMTVQTLRQAEDLTNLTANTDSLIFDALRAVPDKIRQLPTEVSKLMD